MIYEERFITKWHDTSLDRDVRPGAVLTYFQETANLQLEHQGMSLDRLRDERGLAFILSRICIRFYKPLPAYAPVIAQTWVCPSHAFTFPRCYRLLTQKGETVAEAGSVWALLRLRDRSFVRVDEFTYPVESDEPLDELTDHRIRIPKEPYEPAGQRQIFRSECDYNMHMNNTRYPDMLTDFLPDTGERRIRQMTIAFRNERALGHTLTISRAAGADGNSFWLRGEDDGKICFDSEILL